MMCSDIRIYFEISSIPSFRGKVKVATTFTTGFRITNMNNARYAAHMHGHLLNTDSDYWTERRLTDLYRHRCVESLLSPVTRLRSSQKRESTDWCDYSKAL